MLGLQAHARPAMPTQGHKPSQRILGASYGLSCAMQFREGIDPEAKAFIDTSGSKMCRDRLKWLYQKVRCPVRSHCIAGESTDVL